MNSGDQGFSSYVATVAENQKKIEINIRNEDVIKKKRRNPKNKIHYR